VYDEPDWSSLSLLELLEKAQEFAKKAYSSSMSCGGYLQYPFAKWDLVRTSSHISRTLPIPRRRVESKCFHLLIFKRGNIHCAWDSHLNQTADKSLLSIAPPLLRQLDKAGHHLSHGGDADRPYQKQVRTRGRKRTPPSATHHPPPTNETTHPCQNGSATPSAASKRCSLFSQRHFCGGIVRDFACFGSIHPDQLLPHQR
jgi:hypothetical protein